MTERFYSVHVELHAVGGDHDGGFDAILDAYQKLEEQDANLLDSSWSMTLNDDATALVEADITVAGSALDEAWSVATCAIRAAIHASGGHTPSWDEHLQAAAEDGTAYVITERSEVVAVA